MARVVQKREFGDFRSMPRTKPCKKCKATGYRLVNGHIEVECTECNGKGYLQSRGVSKPPKKGDT